MGSAIRSTGTVGFGEAGSVLGGWGAEGGERCPLPAAASLKLGSKDVSDGSVIR